MYRLFQEGSLVGPLDRFLRLFLRGKFEESIPLSSGVRTTAPDPRQVHIPSQILSACSEVLRGSSPSHNRQKDPVGPPRSLPRSLQ